MNQQQLADASGMSKASIARYESGLNAPSLRQFVQLADVLGCSLDVLCGVVPLTLA